VSRSGTSPSALRQRSRRPGSAGEIQPIGVVAIVVVVGLAAILLAPIWTIFDLPFFQVQVSIQPAATVVGDTVHLTATTNLPDGAVVNCYVADATGLVGEEHPVTVAAGAFAIDLPLGPTTGSVEANCHFGTALARQPQNVIDALGSRGERMAGPQVLRTGLTLPKELFATVPLGPIGGGAPAGSPQASPSAS
jgi:hypothetical protein